MNSEKRKKTKKERRRRALRLVIAAFVLTVLLATCSLLLPAALFRKSLPKPVEIATLTPALEPLPTFKPTIEPETPLPIVTATLRPKVTAIDSDVNVRSGPGTDYTIIGILIQGKSATITGYYGKWWRIDYDSTEGWVAAWVVSADNTDSVRLAESWGTSVPPKPTFSMPESATEMVPTGIPGPVFSEGKVSPPWWPCTEGQIKGNNSSGLYHLPGGQYYARTYDDVTCFDNVEQAQAAGFKASKR